MENTPTEPTSPPPRVQAPRTAGGAVAGSQGVTPQRLTPNSIVPSPKNLLKLKVAANERGVTVDQLVEELLQNYEEGSEGQHSRSNSRSLQLENLGEPAGGTGQQHKMKEKGANTCGSPHLKLPVDVIALVFEHLEITTMGKLVRLICNAWKSIVETHPRIRYLLTIGGLGVVGSTVDPGTRGGLLTAASVYNTWLRRWNSLPDSPIARYHSAVAVWDRKVFVAGGRENFKRSNAVEMLDLSERNSKWVRLPNLSSKRSACYCAALNNKLYVMGGFDGNSELGTGEVLDLVKLMVAVKEDEDEAREQYYQTGSWGRSCSSGPKEGQPDTTSSFAHTHQHRDPDDLQRTSSTNGTDPAYRRVAALKWSVMNNEMPFACCEGACVSLGPNLMCIAGGVSHRDQEDERTLNHLQIFNSKTDRWLVGPPMTSARYGFGLAYKPPVAGSDAGLLVAGGGTSQDYIMRSIETLQITSQWAGGNATPPPALSGQHLDLTGAQQWIQGAGPGLQVCGQNTAGVSFDGKLFFMATKHPMQHRGDGGGHRDLPSTCVELVCCRPSNLGPGLLGGKVQAQLNTSEDINGPRCFALE